jgi:hypothetical protein
MAMNNPHPNNSNDAVSKAENFLADLKRQAEEAFEQGDKFTFSLMKQMIGVCSPIVNRAVNRYHREERARINSLGKVKTND